MVDALERRDGMVTITGDAGTGKTILIEDFLKRNRGRNVLVGKLISSKLEGDDLVRMVAYAFGLEVRDANKADMVRQLEKHFTLGGKALLIVDEAQNLSLAALEELRMLTNMHVDYRPVLQVFLLGQRNLLEKLAQPELEQLHQRITATCTLQPLQLEETRAYVEQRLKIAGWSGNPAIANDITLLVHRFSKGLPRHINKVFTRLLQQGARQRKSRLEAGDFVSTFADMQVEGLLPLFGEQKNKLMIRSRSVTELIEKEGMVADWHIYLTEEEREFISKGAAIEPATAYAPGKQAPEPGRVPAVTEHSRVVQLERDAVGAGPSKVHPAGGGRKDIEPRTDDSNTAHADGREDAQVRRPAKLFESDFSNTRLPRRLAISTVAAAILVVAFNGLISSERSEQPTASRSVESAKSRQSAVAPQKGQERQADSPPGAAEVNPVTAVVGSQADSMNTPADAGAVAPMAEGSPGALESTGPVIDYLLSTAEAIIDVKLLANADMPASESAASETAAEQPEGETGLLYSSQPGILLEVTEEAGRLDAESQPFANPGEADAPPVTGDAGTVAEADFAADGGERANGVESGPATSGTIALKPVTVEARAGIGKGDEPADQPTRFSGETRGSGNGADVVFTVSPDAASAIVMEDSTVIEDTVAEAGLAKGATEAAPAVLQQTQGMTWGLAAADSGAVSAVSIPRTTTVTAGEDTVRKGLAEDHDKAVTAETEAAPRTEGEASVQKKNIAAWLQEADKAFAENRLTTPPDKNALHYYRKVLALQPDNSDAERGIDRIGKRYIELASASLKKQQLTNAKRLVRRGLRILPDDRGLIRLDKRIDRELALRERQRLAQLQATEARALSHASEQLLEQRRRSKERERGLFFGWGGSPDSEGARDIFEVLGGNR